MLSILLIKYLKLENLEKLFYQKKLNHGNLLLKINF